MQRGIIAAGHAATADAAAQVMAAGGNAFDGACAALAAACVAEPVLASLGGGGFLLARPAGQEPVIYDFFVQTPRRQREPDGLDFYPILADFGDTTQEFHVGLGSVATPGTTAGLFALQQALCRLSIPDLLAPAQRLARDGVEVTPFQHRLACIVEPILRARPECFALHASSRAPDQLAKPGERVAQPALAEALELLGQQGMGLIYGGEWGRRLTADCAAEGGLLTHQDLTGYRVERRSPLTRTYRDTRLYLNPPPSFGGVLIALALDLLEAAGPPARPFGSSAHRHLLASAMHLAQEARIEADADLRLGLDPGLVKQFRKLMRETIQVRRGTTQISVADAQGNLASLTLSNGEGAGRLLDGTGIMLNNMLGESDLNPAGFHRWPANQRIGSMMCPTLVEHDAGGRGSSSAWTVTGSAGSNRIRSAILQILYNLIDLGMPLAEAVEAPRIHVEDGLVSLEPPAGARVLERLRRDWPALHLWSQRSVFFGGAHSVSLKADGTLVGAGDSRRGGVVREV